MKRKTVLLAIVVLSALIISPAWRVPQDKRDIAAYLIKVVKDVQKKSPAAGWQQAVPLDVLKSGHQVRTDEKSFALIRFADETKLLLREKTVAEIKGQIEGKQILDRNVHTTRGNVGFDVKKQEKEAFRFSSPISVASIRGTTGYFEHQDDQLIDLFGISKGLGTLTNLISDQSVDVSDNQTGVSNGQGNLDVRNSTPGELLLSGANFPTDDELAVPGEPRQHELRFSAQDRSGNRKTIVIFWVQ